jgi:hypothetical protein
LDLARDRNGELAGTITIPAQKITGLPLQKVSVQGRAISFHAREDQPFRLEVAADGKTMSGDVTAGGYSAPTELTWTGEAKINPPVTSPRIAAQLEGTWNGTLEVDGGLRLVLKMSNQPDGTAIGSMMNVDQGSLEIPVRITQEGTSVTLETTVIASSYSGSLNAAGTELTGTFRQGTLSLPLTFRRTQGNQ